jgi:hypothetical protein
MPDRDYDRMYIAMSSREYDHVKAVKRNAAAR